MKTSVPRLRSVTMRATGQRVEVFRQTFLNDKKHIAKRANDLIDLFFSDQMGAAGFALVIWNPDGGHMVAQSAFANSPIPKTLVPDFVRNCLMINATKDVLS